MSFVKGQKVRCIKEVALPEDEEGPCLDWIYTIKDIDDNNCLRFEYLDGAWKPRYFEALKDVTLNIKELLTPIERLPESAIPIKFAASVNKVFLAAESGPPLAVRPWKAADMENQHIAMELQNLTHTGEDEDPMMRMCMHLQDASQLAAKLIKAIADSGDPMGKCLLRVLEDKSIQQPVVLKDAAPAICDLKQSWNSTTFYFSMSWNSHTDIPIGHAKDRSYFRIRDLTIESVHDVERVLRIIRKYAELFNLIIDLTDHNHVLNGFPWKTVMHPFCKPEAPVRL